MRRRSSGFTLLELALVLLVITVLLGGLAVPFTRQIETRRIAETNKAMATIQDALLGYAMSHTTSSCTCSYDKSGLPTGGTCPTANACPSSITGTGNAVTLTMTRHYLPCPDITGDGVEDRTGTACTIAGSASGNNGHVGWLPWATLGLPQSDAWGNRYAYDVVPDYADSSIGFGSSSTLTPHIRQVSICNDHTCTASTPVAAAIISYGPDGLGSFGTTNNQWAATPDQNSSPDEYQNASYGSHNYVSHIATDAGSTNGQFDDLTVGLSLPALLNRVCPAGGCL